MKKLKSFFPWFGGKSRIADKVWVRLGNPDLYIEPFAGSLAVMLANPNWETTDEIVNDMDGMVVNAWRSIQWNPDETRDYARWPVTELDMHARSSYCESRRGDLESLLRSDPEYYDTKIAGWWLWGTSAAIGDAFFLQKKSIPNFAGGKGVLRKTFDWENDFQEMSRRLRGVKVACGDWKRIAKPSLRHKAKVTAFFLDPPYAASDRHDTYAHESYTVASEVEAWCIENGSDPSLRIVLAGYEGDYNMPEDWEVIEWEAHGGMGNMAAEGRGRANRKLERLWCSPHCIDPESDLGLLDIFNEED